MRAQNWDMQCRVHEPHRLPDTLHQPKSFEEGLPLGRKRILLVDGDPAMRAGAAEFLEILGAAIATAETGAEALDRAAEDSFDAIMVDVRLPDMTGYELFVALQTTMGSPPVILMTGFGYDPGHSIVKFRMAGRQTVLFKPFRYDQLLDAIEQVAGAAMIAVS